MRNTNRLFRVVCMIALLLGVLLGVLLASGCGGSRPPEPEPVVARVDGLPITAMQLHEELLRQNLTARSVTEDSLCKAQALDTLVAEKILNLEAEALDLARDHVLQWSMRRSVLQGVIKNYSNEVVEPTLMVTVPDVEQYWREHPEQFTVQRTIVQPQQIYLMQNLKDPGYGSMPEEYDGWDAERIINDLYRRLLEGEDFDTLASYYSQDPFSRGNGGRLSWVFYDTANASPYQDSLFSFPVGELRPPFFHINAYFIVRINDRHEAGEVLALDDRMRKEVADYIAKKRVNEWSQRFRDSLEATAELEIFDSTLLVPFADLPPDLPIAVSSGIDTIFSDDFVNASKFFASADGSKTYQVEDKKRLLQDEHRWRVVWKAMSDVGYLDKPECVKAQKEFLLNAARVRILAGASDPTYRPTNEDITNYYEQHRAEYQVEQPIHVYHIVLDDPDTARAVKARLDAGDDFVATFQQYYHGDTTMGEVVYDLGFISEQEMPAEFYAAALQLSVGEISDPVQTKWGYHVIKLVEKKEQLPLRRIRDEIRGLLINRHKQEVYERWWNELAARHIVTIDYDILGRIPVLPPPTNATQSA